jgi:hypothetical protein
LSGSTTASSGSIGAVRSQGQYITDGEVVGGAVVADNIEEEKNEEEDAGEDDEKDSDEEDEFDRKLLTRLVPTKAGVKVAVQAAGSADTNATADSSTRCSKSKLCSVVCNSGKVHPRTCNKNRPQTPLATGEKDGDGDMGRMLKRKAGSVADEDGSAAPAPAAKADDDDDKADIPSAKRSTLASSAHAESADTDRREAADDIKAAVLHMQTFGWSKLEVWKALYVMSGNPTNVRCSFVLDLAAPCLRDASGPY